MIDSKGQTIEVGSKVEFISTKDGRVRSGEVVSLRQSQHRPWNSKVAKVVESIRVNYKVGHYTTCSIFHKSTNLTVVNETSPTH